MCVVGDTRPQLVPELDVTDLRASLRFYLEVCGFTVRYERVHERFVYLERGRADLMLQEAAGPGRRFRTAPLQPRHPNGESSRKPPLNRASQCRLAERSAPPACPLDKRFL